MGSRKRNGYRNLVREEKRPTAGDTGLLRCLAIMKSRTEESALITRQQSTIKCLFKLLLERKVRIWRSTDIDRVVYQIVDK